MRTVPTHTIVFQSTLSMRRATAVTFYLRVSIVFQSTLSMRRATAELVEQRVKKVNFNPRSP